MKLRDRMIAHDDSIGATKKLSIYLTPHEPRHPHEFGIGGGKRQVVSLGSDIAKELMPHFEGLVTHFTKLGSASCRARVCPIVKISWGAVSVKKKKHTKKE